MAYRTLQPREVEKIESRGRDEEVCYCGETAWVAATRITFVGERKEGERYSKKEKKRREKREEKVLGDKR